ncbi:MAG: TIR domain-containing protein [Rubrobacter sp.]|nr:TIR domain-containing protein [Rubrobacter sp.]
MMSTYQSKVGKLTADIALLRKKLGQEKDREAKKNAELTRTTRSLARTKSESTRRTNENKANRLMGEIARTQKNAADLDKKIADKTKDLHAVTQKLAKEQDKQVKSRRTDELRHERALTQEVRKRRHLETVQRTLAAEFPDYEVPAEDVKYDVFISHASQDKEDFVEPLAGLLSEMGLRVWYDDFVLKVGDSLRQSIDRGITNSEYGLVVLSPHFFAKRWTERELDGLTAREVAGRRKLILPIWHNVGYEDVLEYSPTLADKLALDTGKMSLEEIAEALAEVLPGLQDREDRACSESEPNRGLSSATFDETTTPDTLAEEQGVSGSNFDDLLGDFWPEEEEPEEFASALRGWRRDDSSKTR